MPVPRSGPFEVRLCSNAKIFYLRPMINGIFLALGSNLGNRTANLEQARKKIEQRGIAIYAASGIYETEPWGIREQPAYLNQALQVRTAQTPSELLKTILAIEVEMGRVRDPNTPWQARTIDIDLLLFNQQIIQNKELTLPHPHLHERNFVLYPLVEIAEPFEHPVLKKTIGELLWECNDLLEVVLL